MGWIRKSFPVDREGLTVLKSTLPWRWWENVECRGGGGHALHQSITLWWSIWGWDPPLLLLPVPTGTRTLFWSQHTAAYLLMIRRSDDKTIGWSNNEMITNDKIVTWPDRDRGAREPGCRTMEITCYWKQNRGRCALWAPCHLRNISFVNQARVFVYLCICVSKCICVFVNLFVCLYYWEQNGGGVRCAVNVWTNF